MDRINNSDHVGKGLPGATNQGSIGKDRITNNLYHIRKITQDGFINPFFFKTIKHLVPKTTKNVKYKLFWINILYRKRG